MPRKRPLDVRMREAEDKMDRMKLEKAISDLKARMPRRRRSNRATRPTTMRLF